ncbi:hypothetical protein QJS83_17055 [Bdellovibrio sp. 22V]|uniref:ParB N-terminal domain-containing protein n=1 Tax=Bdellovibrio sp. 22V TaxID=3044166 RepID=UPI0025432DB9|nr:ParB N-terminal domain-containing protein [Bdellovibrio sp. 22V]WII72174.1 hypothetical protein QJS83_17055 [Bdellovibrio sp. 22V]
MVMIKISNLNTENVKLNPGFIIRDVNQKHKEYLKELLIEGVDLGPILLNDKNELLDGRHRLEAYKELGRNSIPYTVSSAKTSAECFETAINMNLRLGLPLSTSEKVQALLLYKKEFLNGDHSARELARKFGLSPSTVLKYLGDRKQNEFEPESQSIKVLPVQNGQPQLHTEENTFRQETLFCLHQKEAQPEAQENEMKRYFFKNGDDVQALSQSEAIELLKYDQVNDFIFFILGSHLAHEVKLCSTISTETEDQ